MHLKQNDSSSYTIPSCFKRKRVNESKSTEENSDRVHYLYFKQHVRNELKSIENKSKPVARPFAHLMTLKRNNDSVF